MLFLPPTNSVKALKAKFSTNYKSIHFCIKKQSISTYTASGKDAMVWKKKEESK